MNETVVCEDSKALAWWIVQTCGCEWKKEIHVRVFMLTECTYIIKKKGK